MTKLFNRRTFIELCSALGAWAARPLSAEPQSAHRAGSGEVKHRDPVILIAVPPYSWIDEGTGRALDNMQGKGAVNTVWAYTNCYDQQRIRKGGRRALPDHGVYGTSSTPYAGGAFFEYDKKYFQDTCLRNFRAPDYGNFNVITAVAPEAKKRGMDFIAWDYNNTFDRMARNVPNFPAVAEVDVYGRRTNYPCFNNPDYRNYLLGKIQCYLKQYSSEVDGIAWGCERMGPLGNATGGPFSRRGISCFCPYCLAKARARGISVDRARLGYQKLDQFISAALKNERPTDGYFVTYWRLVYEYPEISAWELLWTDSYHEARAAVYGTAKAISPEKPFGFHIMQEVTFSPFYRAEENYSVIENYTDFLEIATYSTAGGPRLASYLHRLASTIFHDASPDEFTEFYYKIMNIQEAPYDKLPTTGLSADYVARETKRALTDTGGKVQIYPGVDIDVPDGPNQVKTTPDRVRQEVKAAFGAGANGVRLARDYNEMWLAHLAAAGEAIREIFPKSAG